MTIATATLTARYSFTAQFIAGSALLVRRAREIESQAAPTAVAICEHRALVVGAIIQSAAALEDELREIVQHGPGHHLGSNGIDHDARAFIAPLEDVIDRQQGLLDRWDLLLHLLRKPQLDQGRQLTQDVDLLAGLRNELVHFRSNWEGKMNKATLVRRLEAKAFARPPFVPAQGTLFFPHRLLGAACAQWAYETATAFIDHVYELIGKTSVLDGHRRGDAEYARLVPPRRS